MKSEMWGVERLSEGVKQIRGKRGLRKYFFIPLAGENLLHTFTIGIDKMFCGHGDHTLTLEIVDLYRFLRQKMTFLGRCEIHFFIVVLFCFVCLRVFTMSIPIVKVAI